MPLERDINIAINQMALFGWRLQTQNSNVDITHALEAPASLTHLQMSKSMLLQNVSNILVVTNGEKGMKAFGKFFLLIWEKFLI